MDERCVLIEDLGELLALPSDDPRMVHVADCPRCQSRLLSYREFLRRDDVLEGALEDEADARLKDLLEATIQGKREAGEVRGVPGADGVGEAHGAGNPHGSASGIESSRGPRTDPFRKLRERGRWRRVFWPSFATLAVVTAVLAVVLLSRPGDQRPIVPRGDQTEPGQGGPLPAPAEWLPGGGCLLRWTGVIEADAYRVLILDAGLDEVARLEPTKATSFTLDPGRVQGLRGDRRAAYWQVEALHQGDVIAAGPPQPWTPWDR